jgi:hypothetical protein
VRIQKQ